MKLQGKTTIITGGGRDIGRACALKLAAEGSNIAINYFSSSETALSAVEEIKAAGGNAFALQGDLNTQEGVDALVNKTVAEFGGIDVLVNNTGGLIARKTIAAAFQRIIDRILNSICLSAGNVDWSSTSIVFI